LKKASPSAGVLRPGFRPVELALELEKAGAAALSVVTEPRYFQGMLETLAGVRWRTGLPLLRKDFIVDPYQVLEARHSGADAVLLIAALLEGPLLGALRAEVERLGMDALVEVHDEDELERALQAGATLIGVNSRDLRTFQVSIETSLGLARRIPEGVVAVAESGLRTAGDVRRLRDAGYRAFLVGEQLMRAISPGAALKALIPRAASGAGRIS
jgi:indole-3-glycerol phosphate synthase